MNLCRDIIHDASSFLFFVVVACIVTMIIYIWFAQKFYSGNFSYRNPTINKMNL